ncbi:metal ABC transporter solute-binding protein, Zn/Mn family [Kocuria sp. M1N1S27]|uniref:metal ABC transporter solute-binding protein, Zn/Mn family n=1 Tax=Kocuria kalidii TaxID=3376283 RepID=UPI0037A3B5A9
MTALRPRARPGAPLRAAGLAGAVAVLGLTACASGSARATGADEALTVVTTTTVYADLVREVGGEAVAVDPVVGSPAQDPRSYEPTDQDRLAVRDADLVVLNGGGHDVFMEDLAARGDAPVVDAYEVSGLAGAPPEPAHEGHEHEDHEHAESDEHVWYDLDAMDNVAHAVADGLAELDPAGASVYEANAGAFADRLGALRQRIGEVPADNAAFVAADPVAVHLLEDAGLHDDTPVELSAAVAAGTDVPPLVLQRIRDGIRSGHVQLLAFGAPADPAGAGQLRDDAPAGGAAVVEFTAAPPEGSTYLEWMDRNVTAVAEALTALRPAGG